MTTLATKLPKVLRLEYATLIIPDDLTDVDSLKELTVVFAEVNKLLALLSDEDKRNAEYENGLGWSISTENQEAIRYACDYGYLNQLDCVIGAICAKYVEDLSSDELDELIDQSLDRDFEIQSLTGGVCVIFNTEAG